MSTHHQSPDPAETTPTEPSTETAPLMFATDNESRIQGHFTAESENHDR